MSDLPGQVRGTGTTGRHRGPALSPEGFLMPAQRSEASRSDKEEQTLGNYDFLLQESNVSDKMSQVSKSSVRLKLLNLYNNITVTFTDNL